MGQKSLPTTGAQAASELHAKCQGGPGWCVGVTSDPERRLAAVHMVDLRYGQYHWIECASERVAREAEHVLFEEHGYKSPHDSFTMGEGMTFLYAYRPPDEV